MPKRQLIHHKAASGLTPQGVYTELKKTYHFHFCADRDCRQIYEDYRCDNPAKNGRCHECRGLRKSLLVTARDPHDCCYGNTHVVTRPDELVRYRLAGPGPWFQCKTCFRAHGWPCADPNERNS